MRWKLFSKGASISHGLGRCASVWALPTTFRQIRRVCSTLLQAIEIMPDASVAFFLSARFIHSSQIHKKRFVRRSTVTSNSPGRMPGRTSTPATSCYKCNTQPASDFEPVIRLLQGGRWSCPRVSRKSLQLGLVLRRKESSRRASRLFEQAVASAPDMWSLTIGSAYQRSGSKSKLNSPTSNDSGRNPDRERKYVLSFK